MNTFEELLQVIMNMSGSFDENSVTLVDWIDSLEKNQFVFLVEQIGTIPESIEHDSTEEKLFSKATDAALARAFREIGLKSTVLKERSDSADVFAESKYHGYTLVADAKAFRLSRTARNQKDYKVAALSNWRNDNDYAVLCAPFFQYPSTQSQIYKQAIDNNVCLFSWEQILIMLNQGVVESPEKDFRYLWNWSDIQAGRTTAKNAKACFLNQEMTDFANFFGLSCEDISAAMNSQIERLRERGQTEIEFWDKTIEEINQYTKEQAITELIAAKKIPNKIQTIKTYVSRLSYE